MTVNTAQVEDFQTSQSLVLLPDIFDAFGAQESKLHPDYQSVKIESETWLAQYLDLNVKAQAKLARADFTYFIGVWMAESSREAFRIGADWMNWAFFFDDEFEVRSLRDNLERAKAAIDAVLATISDDGIFPESAGASPISLGLLESHADIFQRLRSLGSGMLVNRYRQSMERYTAGILGQVLDLEYNRTRTVDEMVELSRDSLGILPCSVLLQLGLDAELPDFVLNHPLIKVEVLSSDLVIIHNDIVSYAKEESPLEDAHNLPHNPFPVIRG